jgi:DNA polymerase-3 subunit alpha
MLSNAGEDSGGFAITNHGTMNSIGYMAATQKKYHKKGAPVRLIYGCEFYYVPSLDEWNLLKLQSDEAKKEEKKRKKDEDDDGLVFENEAESKAKHFDPIKRRNHLVVCAYNQEGLKNLFRLVTRSHRQGFYRKPRIDFRMLEELNEGLIASTACIAGVPAYNSIQSKTMEEAHQRYDKELLPLMEIFGKDRFYLELQFNKLEEQALVNQHLIEYSKKTGYKLIATADAHFPKPTDWKSRELYRLLGYQQKGEEIDRSILDQTEKDLKAVLYLKNGDQMFQEYKDTFSHIYSDEQLIKEAIERTYDIAHNFCEHVFPDSSTKLPKPSKVKDGKTSFDVLKEETFAALKAKGLATKKEYFDRLVHELKIIGKLNLSDYFLVLKEMIDELKKYMLIGNGRGSGAGSLVDYLLGVTLLDPIKHELLFERFLSSTKASADVDTDLELREEALDILKRYFGEQNVIAISNYNKLQLKSIVKDLSRLFQIPFQEVNTVTSVMEKEARDKILAEINHDQKLYEFTYERALEHSPTFKAYITKYPAVGQYIEGLYQENKSIGKHAGGILVLSDTESCVPVIKSGGIFQSPITEGITAQHNEYFGLIKYDMLGLSTLKIIRRCIENILKKEGINNPTIADVWAFYNAYLSADVIDDKDQKVFEATYNAGVFPSVFQFEKPNAQAFCTQAKPESVYDIAVITSLFRPGPLGGGADKKYLHYEESKLRKEHSIIQKILGKTRGVLCFQEQFIQLAHELADMSLEEADQLRKILVKPSQELGEELKKKRQEYREKFISGCINKGLPPERATKLWDEEIIGFISYGFNKSHAIAYAYTSYCCSWLYTYYPTEWLKACLEKDPELDKTIATTRSIGYEVSKVDVNLSDIKDWTCVDKIWLPPLVSLKGLGEIGACELVNQREDGFKDLHDFFFNEYGAFRWSKLNKKCIEALVKTEAMASLKDIGPDKVIKNYKHLHEFLNEHWEKFKKGKVKLDEAGLMDVPDWTAAEKILIQKEITGFYDKSLIVSKLLKTFKDFNISAIDEYYEDDEQGPMHKVWALVEEIEHKPTKTGKSQQYITVSGMSNKLFKFKAWLKPDQIKDWQIGNAMVFSLQYSPEWGYNLDKHQKYLRITK